jgi:hypothetical protein
MHVGSSLIDAHVSKVSQTDYKFTVLVHHIFPNVPNKSATVSGYASHCHSCAIHP